jgi:phage N-6-adenine-methyltransferase
VQSVKDEYEKAKRITEPSDYDFSDDATDYDWTEDEESPEQAYIEPEEVAIVSKPHVSNNSGNNEWYTPSEYVEAARKVLGVIELDPASSPEANQVVKAKVYYTVNDDGLQFDWHGKVWMNPPYASGLIDRFATKIVFHYENKDITEAIILVNNATETGWFNEIINASSAAIFPKSRVRFWKPDGELGAPLQGQAIMYLGANKESFLREFSKFGWGAEIVIPR